LLDAIIDATADDPREIRPASDAATRATGADSEPRPSTRSHRGLDWLNFLLADVQTGVGPFLAIYLAGYGWNEQRVGLALTIGSIAGIAAQTPAGGLVDRLNAKRALIAAGVCALAIGALVIAFLPSFWPVVTAQTLIGVMSSVFIPAIAAISLGLVGRRRFDRRQGRNQTVNSAGNVAAALMMGLIGHYISNRGVFSWSPRSRFLRCWRCC
jgi:MFS family permease